MKTKYLNQLEVAGPCATPTSRDEHGRLMLWSEERGWYRYEAPEMKLGPVRDFWEKKERK